MILFSVAIDNEIHREINLSVQIWMTIVHGLLRRNPFHEEQRYPTIRRYHPLLWLHEVIVIRPILLFSIVANQKMQVNTEHVISDHEWLFVCFE